MGITYGIGLGRINILTHFKYHVLIVTCQRPIMAIVHMSCIIIYVVGDKIVRCETATPRIQGYAV
jgi:hypothetical protein